MFPLFCTIFRFWNYKIRGRTMHSGFRFQNFEILDIESALKYSMFPLFCNVPLILYDFRVLKLQNKGPPLYTVIILIILAWIFLFLRSSRIQPVISVSSFSKLPLWDACKLWLEDCSTLLDTSESLTDSSGLELPISAFSAMSCILVIWVISVGFGMFFEEWINTPSLFDLIKGNGKVKLNSDYHMRFV